MSPAPFPRAMVVLASEQLWPNIHGIVHWHKRQTDGGLSDLCIYRTGDEKHSGKPAHRLKELCKELYPEIILHVPDKPLGLRPDDVQEQIRAWQARLGRRRWVINATGGVKLMFAGVLDLITEPETQVVYREFSGDWYALTRVEGRIHSELIDVPVEETDAIPVAALVKAHWEPSEHVLLTCDPLPPSSLSALALTRAGVRCGWDWQRTFAAVGDNSPGRGGVPFERFAAVVLRECGVTNLVMNLKLTSRRGEKRQSLQEIDVVGNYGGRLVIVDCKLRSEEEEEAGQVESVMSQIRQAATTQSHLGGRGARLILLRPNRVFSEDERSLAQACGLAVLDADDAWHLFSRLADWLGIQALPADLREAEVEVQKSRAAGMTRAFARESLSVRRLTSGSPSRAVVDLEASLGNYLRESRREWIAFWHGDVLCVRCAVPPGMPREQLPKELDRLLGSFGRLETLTLSNSRKTCRFLFYPGEGQREPLIRYLESLCGRSLLP
jgi:predicted RecB family endonuclease